MRARVQRSRMARLSKMWSRREVGRRRNGLVLMVGHGGGGSISWRDISVMLAWGGEGPTDAGTRIKALNIVPLQSSSMILYRGCRFCAVSTWLPAGRRVR